MRTVTAVPEPAYRKRPLYQAGLLGGICCLASVMLLLGDLETGGAIEQRLEEDRLATLTEVMPASLYDNNPLEESRTFTETRFFADPVTVMSARKNERLAAAAVQASVQGWGGKIHFIIGVDAGGEIIGVRVISHTETPGLADKIEVKKDPWITRFNGRSLANTPAQGWAVKKDRGVFDQFTGATITPRALVNGVHRGLQFYEFWLNSRAASSRTDALSMTATAPRWEDKQIPPPRDKNIPRQGDKQVPRREDKQVPRREDKQGETAGTQP